MDHHPSRRAVSLSLAAAAASLAAGTAFAQNTYSENEVVNEANEFLDASAEAVSDVVRHVFSEYGEPVGYIKGREGGGAAGIGFRLGDGNLFFQHSTAPTRVFWRGPSIGIDAGGDAARVFTLIYNMTNTSQIFRRFPGVEGSAYFVGGVGVNYQRKDGVVLAPMRAGVGLRLGANVGYLAYSRRRNFFPF
jgi:hypothetical protein